MKIIPSKINPRAQSLFAGLVLSLAIPAYGKVTEGADTLVNFNGKNGAQPQSVIEDSAGNFYGTTAKGGTYNMGTVYEIKQDGQLVTLQNFNGANGADPEAGLILGPDGSLYGTTKAGGIGGVHGVRGSDPKDMASDPKDMSDPKGMVGSGLPGDGTVFKVAPNGAFSTLVFFNGANGAVPQSGLLMDPGGNIYGSTLAGGADNDGTVFKLSPNDTLSTLVTFNGTNGSNPGSLVFGDNGNLYGTASHGGSNSDGTIFELTLAGKLTTLVNFTGSNGAFPVSGLILSENGNFYGATQEGGKNNLGTVYDIMPDGTLTTLVSFNGTNGSHPDSGLVEWNNGYFYMVRQNQNLYVRSAGVQWSGDTFLGTTKDGGVNGYGTIYRIGDDGDLVTVLSFTGNRGVDLGADPNSLVAGQDGNLYGTTSNGGYDGEGTVFRLQLQLWILPASGDGVGASYINFQPPIISH